MGIFRKHYSSKDLVQIFVYCAFPIHLWTILNTLQNIPSWSLYMKAGELFGTIAYMTSFAFVETLFLLLPVLLIGLLFPAGWTKERYVPLASGLLLEAACAAALFQFSIRDDYPKDINALVILLIMGISVFPLLRFPKIGQTLKWLAERLSVLTGVYIFMDMVGLSIIILRNF